MGSQVRAGRRSHPRRGRVSGPLATAIPIRWHPGTCHIRAALPVAGRARPAWQRGDGVRAGAAVAGVATAPGTASAGRDGVHRIGNPSSVVRHRDWGGDAVRSCVGGQQCHPRRALAVDHCGRVCGGTSTPGRCTPTLDALQRDTGVVGNHQQNLGSGAGLTIGTVARPRTRRRAAALRLGDRRPCRLAGVGIPAAPGATVAASRPAKEMARSASR